jgi:hypothetical protein
MRPTARHVSQEHTRLWQGARLALNVLQVGTLVQWVLRPTQPASPVGRAWFQALQVHPLVLLVNLASTLHLRQEQCVRSVQRATTPARLHHLHAQPVLLASSSHPWAPQMPGQ